MCLQRNSSRFSQHGRQNQRKWKREEEKRKKREEELERIRREKAEREEAKRKAKEEEEARRKAKEEAKLVAEEKARVATDAKKVKQTTVRSSLLSTSSSGNMSSTSSTDLNLRTLSPKRVSPLAPSPSKSNATVSPLVESGIPPFPPTSASGVFPTMITPSRRVSAPSVNSMLGSGSPKMQHASRLGHQPPATLPARPMFPAPYFVPALPTIPDNHAIMNPLLMAQPRQIDQNYIGSGSSNQAMPVSMPSRARMLSHPDVLALASSFGSNSSAPSTPSYLTNRFNLDSMERSPQKVGRAQLLNVNTEPSISRGHMLNSLEDSVVHGLSSPISVRPPTISNTENFESTEPSATHNISSLLSRVSAQPIKPDRHTSLGSKALGGDVANEDAGVDWDLPPQKKPSQPNINIIADPFFVGNTAFGILYAFI